MTEEDAGRAASRCEEGGCGSRPAAREGESRPPLVNGDCGYKDPSPDGVNGSAPWDDPGEALLGDSRAAGSVQLRPQSLSLCDDSMASFPRVAPERRVDVIFEDLRVCTRAFRQKERKTLLHGVSGRFRAGELVAVMGPSGAGKTTLLNTISGFTSGMRAGGVLQMQYPDGRITTSQRVSCYLTQEDHLFKWFTAQEIVTQAADLKVGSRLSKKARQLLVDEVLEALGLESCRKTRANQLSGGQRKRLAIAAELVDNPTVVFLDEPTSGLDTNTAVQCCQLMRRIARSGRAVICTIHQPSENMLTFFDQVYVLSQGQCVYRDIPSNFLKFLGNLGFQCPMYHNPADFLIEVANNEHGYAVQAMADAVMENSFQYPPPLPDIKDSEANSKAADNEKKDLELLVSKERCPPSEWERFRVLVTRGLMQQHRDWITTHIKVISAFFVGVTLGLVFGPIGDNADRVISNVALLFALGLYVCYTPEAPALFKYPDEISIVKREWFNNWYRLPTYCMASFVSALPLHVMTNTILCTVSYYMTGQLAEPMRFAQVTLTLILTSMVSESLGLQFGSMFLKKKIISLFLASTHLAFLILFSGFIALKPEMPDWFGWLTKLSHLHYSINSCTVALYQNRSRMHCPEDVFYCHLRDPDSLMTVFGFSDSFGSEVWHNLLALIIYTLILRISGFFTLRYNVKNVDV